jgi:sulfopyruvate decarboxylase TPP-binding subunit
MIVSMRGETGEWNSAQVPMGRAVRPICEAIGIACVTADRPEATAEAVGLAGRRAFAHHVPSACLLSRRLTVPAAS